MDVADLKRQLEDLRMAPFRDLPPIEDVPCNETSDATRLCANPVVSVLLITYNHADNIRAAIEAVMMQKTDFPYELIIGEDASSDGTREICFEMQRKHPDRIRVLWSEANVYAMNGNIRRVFRAVRGEFLACCEGDDRWVDPNKLQRQVELMRANPNIGICLGGTEVEHVAGGRVVSFPWSGGGSRLVGGEEFVRIFLGMSEPKDFAFQPLHYQTSGYLIRRSSLAEAKRRFPEAHCWNWRFGDLILLTTVAMVSDVALVVDCVSRYRLTETNASATQGEGLILEGLVYDVYLRVKGLGQSLESALDAESRRLRSLLGRVLSQQAKEVQMAVAQKTAVSPSLGLLFLAPGYRLVLPFLRRGALTRGRWKVVYRVGRICDRIFARS